MLIDSGGADRIALTFIEKFGIPRIQWAMLLAACVIGIPLFFEVGFVLMVPLALIVAARAKVPYLKIGMPLLAGLSAVHGLVPPHPGPVLAIQAFGADMGKTIVYGLIVAVPAAIIAGPMFGTLASGWVSARAPAGVEVPGIGAGDSQAPAIGIVLTTLLLPVALMISKSVADVTLLQGNSGRTVVDLLGNPIVSLLLAVLLSLRTFGTERGIGSKQILTQIDASLRPIGSIILIIGAGGSFKQMLIATGIGQAVGHLAMSAHIPIIILAWVVAATVRIATGSATVAVVTGSGIVAPLVAFYPGVNRELLVLATGAGSLMLSHVNDAGFWLVKEYFKLTIAETFKTWTLMECILSVGSLIFISLLSFIL
jgi:GntP family gluconate:H+ symporter